MKGSAVRVRASALTRFAGNFFTLDNGGDCDGGYETGTSRDSVPPGEGVQSGRDAMPICRNFEACACADVSDRESRKCPRGDVRARVSPAVVGRSARTLPRLDFVDHGGDTLLSQRFHLDRMTRPGIGPRTFITTVRELLGTQY